jgi:signal transduction histidine kinase
MQALPPRVKAYAVAIAVAAALAAALWAWVWPSQCCAAGPGQLLLLAGFAALIAAALLFPLRLSAYYLLTVDGAAAICALLLFGPLPAMAAAAGGSLAANLVQAARGKRDRWNVLFNAGKSALVVALAGVPSFGLAGMRAPVVADRLPAVLACLAAVAVFHVCNTFAVSAAIGLQHGRSPLPIWLESVRVGSTHAQVLLVAGVLTALLAPAHPWAVGFLVLLMGLTYQSLRQTLRLLDQERLARETAELESRARGEFLALAAHELRTPITSLRGYAQRLLRRIAGGQPVEGPAAHRALEVIDRQSDKLARLVTQLVDVSRVQAGTLSLDYQPADISALAAEVAATARAAAPNPLVVSAAPGIVATVDALRLEQVLVNLVDNAVKYSVDQESPIDIEVQQPTPRTVQISVRDRGLGIPEAHRQHVFERFYQVGGSREVGGMGLGLYISRQIVESHGGAITLESPPDGGTRFVVTLPSTPATEGRDVPDGGAARPAVAQTAAA